MTSHVPCLGAATPTNITAIVYQLAGRDLGQTSQRRRLVYNNHDLPNPEQGGDRRVRKRRRRS